MGTKRNNTIATDAKLASAGKNVGVIPQTKVAASKLVKDAIEERKKQLTTRGVVVPAPPRPHPWDEQIAPKPSELSKPSKR